MTSGTIEGFRVTRYEWPRDRPIGDSQVRSEWHHSGTLELMSTSGQVGLGFFGALFYPLPPERELARVFAEQAFPGLEGENPHVLTHRVRRPRGGNIGKGAGMFGLAVIRRCGIWRRRNSICRSIGCSAARTRVFPPTPAGWTTT